MSNFALIGAAGYVAPRHIEAINNVGGDLIVATDPSDSVGVLDRYFMGAKYFREIEAFDRYVEKLSYGNSRDKITHVSVCSPNYLHVSHAKMAMRLGADVICEKPVVIDPKDLDYLELVELETCKKVSCVLQLRVHPDLIALKRSLDTSIRSQVTLTYVASRGNWYQGSWKGDEARSGGIATNIGIHLFDLLIWLFGGVGWSDVHLKQDNKMSGFLGLENADVRWYLSTDPSDIYRLDEPGAATHRSIKVDGHELEFTRGFTDLHTEIYTRTLDGRGFGIADARPSIELVNNIRGCTVSAGMAGCTHPIARGV